ncbi:MAG: beta-lactamase family protein [Acidimicrobiales bacterium]|nr:beta-lactamase family protein [Acidimicrobiales bacterium]
MTALDQELTPEEAGLDPVRLQRLERHLDRYVDERRRLGTVIAITRGGKVAYVYTNGHRDVEAGLPAETDTIWRIYSMTKPITSVAALMLHEEGALSLTDPVAKYIPSFAGARIYRFGPAAAPLTVPAQRPITVWNLLTHTSGLTYGFTYGDPVGEAYRLAGFNISEPETYTLEEACDRLATLPLLFEPGTQWNYSHSTDVLARVVEVVSGRPIDQFFSEQIFQPLKMADSGYVIDEAAAPRLAVLYSLDPRSGKVLATPDADSPRTEPRSFHGGGHGLVSTAADYHRFTQMLLRKGELDGVRLLSPKTVDLMVANHLPGGADIASFGRPSPMTENYAGRGFGLGVAPLVDPVAAKSLSSRGEYTWGGAAGTAFWVDPAEDLTVLFFTQVLFAMDELSNELRRLVYQALVG